MPRITPHVQKTVKKSYTAKLTATEIRRRFRLPANARLMFQVPQFDGVGGEAIELDDINHGIEATWETEK